MELLSLQTSLNCSPEGAGLRQIAHEVQCMQDHELASGMGDSLEWTVETVSCSLKAL